MVCTSVTFHGFYEIVEKLGLDHSKLFQLNDAPRLLGMCEMWVKVRLTC